MTNRSKRQQPDQKAVDILWGKKCKTWDAEHRKMWQKSQTGEPSRSAGQHYILRTSSQERAPRQQRSPHDQSNESGSQGEASFHIRCGIIIRSNQKQYQREAAGKEEQNHQTQGMIRKNNHQEERWRQYGCGGVGGVWEEEESWAAPGRGPYLLI